MPNQQAPQLLKAHILQRDRAWLLAHPDAPLTIPQARRLRSLIRRLRSGTPLAYLIGRREFYGRDFSVRRGVLIPRPETEHLVEAANTFIRKPAVRLIADIGTGSGCIGITIALNHPGTRVVATDRSSVAIRVARRNARTFRLQQRFTVFRGSFLAPLQRRGIRPDLIVANLPYLKPNEINLVRREPRMALVGGNDGVRPFHQLFSQLKHFGWFVPVILEIDPRRARMVIRIVQRVWPDAKIRLQPDLAGRQRILVIEPISGTRPADSTA